MKILTFKSIPLLLNKTNLKISNFRLSAVRYLSYGVPFILPKSGTKTETYAPDYRSGDIILFCRRQLFTNVGAFKNQQSSSY